MPISRDPSKPQHSLSEFHYGSLPIEGMPAGPADQIALALWDGTQWQLVSVVGLGGLEVNYDAASLTLELSQTQYRYSFTFSADSYLMPGFKADSILKVADIANTVTADAYLVSNVETTFTADAVLV